jgi:hypothetical protein
MSMNDNDGALAVIIIGQWVTVSLLALMLPDGNYYLPGTDEVIPADMASPSPDDPFSPLFLLSNSKSD